MLRIYRVAVAILMLAAAGPSHAGMYSVKIVKPQPGRTTGEPSLRFVEHGVGWRVVNRPWHSGENDWEIYYEIEHPDDKPPMPVVAITAPGVGVSRAIVGKTDVRFETRGDTTTFKMIDDRGRGQLMQINWSHPKDGRVISFIQNWEMRRSWQYLDGPWPAKQVAAVHNYLLAAAEVLRQMGDMGPGGTAKKFDGEIVLMGAEVAATRGHMDWPQHVHIMHYEHAQVNGKRDYVSRLVPHFYMNDAGVIDRNSYAVIVGRGRSGELKLDDVCRFEDSSGRHVLDLIVKRDGLVMRRADGEQWSLRGDEHGGPATAVFGYLEGQVVCRAQCHDEPARGEFTITLDIYEDHKVKQTIRSGYRYDPFTAKVLSRK